MCWSNHPNRVGNDYPPRCRDNTTVYVSTDNISNWSGNNGLVEDENWYADLGYFVGARICEAYYEQAEDKRQAIEDLLFISDPAAILEASGYAARFRGCFPNSMRCSA